MIFACRLSLRHITGSPRGAYHLPRVYRVSLTNTNGGQVRILGVGVCGMPDDYCVSVTSQIACFGARYHSRIISVNRRPDGGCNIDALMRAPRSHTESAVAPYARAQFSESA